MIIFKRIRFRNLLSYGNYWTEIDLSSNKRTLFVGKNGHGKSTLLDAITFALYGKPFRKINKPQLLNSINKKALSVELEFSVFGDEYKIIRGIKPDTFEIFKNEKLLDVPGAKTDYQSILETQILKRSMKTFTQVDILGSAKYTSFMELSTPARREVIEDLLDLQIFSSMNVITKKKITENDKIISDLEKQLEFQELERDKYLKVKNSSKDIYEDEIKILEEENNKTILQYNQDMVIETEETNKLNILNVEVKEMDSSSLVSKKNDILVLNTKLSTKNETLQQEINFFHKFDDCPTCKQKISLGFKAESIEEKNLIINENQEKINKLAFRKEEIDSKLLIINEKKKELETQQYKVSRIRDNIKNLLGIVENNKRKINNLKDKMSNSSEKLEEEIIDIQIKISDTEKQLNNYKSLKKKLSIILNSLKDTGVKALIIKEYIPILNKLITKYLNKMDYLVSFELNENFEETIKSRHCDEFTYNSFSEGQKMRLSLAILFAFRDVARLRNSVSSNLLLMDEILNSSMDAEGTDKILDILAEGVNISNIIVISHKTEDIIDSFDRVLSFEMKQNFSQMKELNN